MGVPWLIGKGVMSWSSKCTLCVPIQSDLVPVPCTFCSVPPSDPLWIVLHSGFHWQTCRWHYSTLCCLDNPLSTYFTSLWLLSDFFDILVMSFCVFEIHFPSLQCSLNLLMISLNLLTMLSETTYNGLRVTYKVFLVSWSQYFLEFTCLDHHH